ncbi:MAG: CBS domain-containing protein [Firmicutes bacterium]|nr:CBS domain-containing protein [Bacillota bacterium]
MKLVRDIMARDITSVTEEDTLEKVAWLLTGYRFGGVPVVDAEGKVKGFISEKDIIKSHYPFMGESGGYFVIRSFAEVSKKLDKQELHRVREFMTSPAISVSEEDTVVETINIMLEKGLRILPVTRDGILIGVVGRTEICKEIFRTESD